MWSHESPHLRANLLLILCSNPASSKPQQLQGPQPPGGTPGTWGLSLDAPVYSPGRGGMSFPSHVKDRDTEVQSVLTPTCQALPWCTSHLYFFPPFCLSHRRSPGSLAPGCPSTCVRVTLGDGAGLWLELHRSLSRPSRRMGNFLRLEGLLPLRSYHTRWERTSQSPDVSSAPSWARPSRSSPV